MTTRRSAIVISSTCLCLILASILAPPGASAAGELYGTCVGTVSWSITLSAATAVYTPTVCNGEQASAGTNGLLPQYGLNGGASVPPSFTEYFNYTPVNGFCDGMLSGTNQSWTWTGVIHNDGNESNLVVLTASTTNPYGGEVQVQVGVLQPACSSSFTDTATWTEAWVAAP